MTLSGEPVGLDLPESLTQTVFVSLDPTSLMSGRTNASLRTRGILRSLAHFGHGLHVFAPCGDDSAEELAGLGAIHRLPLEPACTYRETVETSLALNVPLRRGLEALAHHPSGAPGLLYERHSCWSYAALEWARDRRIPSILELNDRPFENPGDFSDDLHAQAACVIARRAVSAATTTIATSEGIAEWVRSLGASAQLHVVAEGSDTERYLSLANAAPSPRGSEPPLTIGFVGLLTPAYGLQLLFEAFACLSDRQPADRLLVIGNGPERPQFDQLARQLGIASQVHWEAKAASDATVESLACMDIAVAPYLPQVGEGEDLGQLFDYMSAARPIIAARLKPIERILHHGRSAWLVRPNDAIGIATAISILRRRPALRAYLARRAHASLRDQPTWNHVVRTILGHLRSDAARASSFR